MGESRKSKRVSWATDVNLCQVRLFLCEDSPSQVRIGTQDHLQAKPYRSGDDNLPPGFEGLQQPPNPWTAKLSQIPLTKWKCPFRFAVNIAWQVVAGEESKEIETQNQREMRVLEAIYPRTSAIPPKCYAYLFCNIFNCFPLFIIKMPLFFSLLGSPSELLGIQEPTKGWLTPIVPITPIEDEDASIVPPAHLAASSSLVGSAISANPPPTGVKPDLLSAARATLAAAFSKGGGNINNHTNNSSDLIDQTFLVEILSDPKMIEQLITPGTSEISQNVLPPGMQFGPNLTAFNLAGRRDLLPPPPPPPPPLSFTLGLGPRQPMGSFYPPRAVQDVGPGPRPPVARDANYYKSLIQQHGGERRESGPQFGLQGQPEHMKRSGREMKPKMMKPCIYFNSSKGCRNGADCLYQHDTLAGQRLGSGSGGSSSSVAEVQSGKRPKLDGEIKGL